jgi:hypothetical protein
MPRVKLTLSAVRTHEMSIDVSQQDYEILRGMENKPLSTGSYDSAELERITLDPNVDFNMRMEPSTLIVEKL